jgi:uncharacterized protein with von Willebrand factor type A (vWA) domain
MREDRSQNPAASVVEFCRFLRMNGFSGHLRQELTALQASKQIDIADSSTFASALRSALCCNREEWEGFPKFFQYFWEEAQARPRSSSGEYRGPSKGNATGRGEGASVFLDQRGTDALPGEGMGKAVFGASAQSRLRKVDFSEVPADDIAALEEICVRLVRRMSRRLSRRFVVNSRGIRIDLRRSIRRSIATGGEPMVLAYKKIKPAKRRFVLLLDVSGSMNFYSLFLVRFAYALQASVERVETFLFSTSVVSISDLLRAHNLMEALRRLSQRDAGWSGGTKIGESLHEFNQRFGRRLLTRDTVFMILSDGWETGEPELLANELRATRKRVMKTVWLNPLLGLKEYQPVTRGMAAALPHVDVFAPAHNLESLLALEKRL